MSPFRNEKRLYDDLWKVEPDQPPNPQTSVESVTPP